VHNASPCYGINGRQEKSCEEISWSFVCIEKESYVSTVNIVTAMPSGQAMNAMDSPWGKRGILFSETSRPARVSTQVPMNWVPRVQVLRTVIAHFVVLQSLSFSRLMTHIYVVPHR
jgi:hypothetical protein